MTRVGILGPGGVGGFLAAALTHAGEEVTVVAREQTAEHIRRHGIAVQSVRLGSFTARPQATAALTEPVEVLLIATKAPSVVSALKRIRVQPRLVVPQIGRAHV